MLYLVGFMGCGKTTLGVQLASRLGYDFVDTDVFIEQFVGKTISDIFKERGEVGFRELENEALRRLQLRDCCVVSTGGGMSCSEDNQDVISQGVVVYLRADSSTLANRILQSPQQRPLV